MYVLYELRDHFSGYTLIGPSGAIHAALSVQWTISSAIEDV